MPDIFKKTAERGAVIPVHLLAKCKMLLSSPDGAGKKAEERFIAEEEKLREADKDLPVISTANAENDDWLKKAYPEHREQEMAILAALRKKYEAEGR